MLPFANFPLIFAFGFYFCFRFCWNYSYLTNFWSSWIRWFCFDFIVGKLAVSCADCKMFLCFTSLKKYSKFFQKNLKYYYAYTLLQIVFIMLTFYTKFLYCVYCEMQKHNILDKSIFHKFKWILIVVSWVCCNICYTGTPIPIFLKKKI